MQPEINQQQKKTSSPGIPATVMMLVIIFTAGYVVMALEILAFRIVQVGYGATIYSTGAVLTVVLASLSLGYWAGGSMSVRLNPVKIQATVLIVSGIWIFLLAGIPKSAGALLETQQGPRSDTGYYLETPWKTVPDWVFEQSRDKSEEYGLKVDPLIVSVLLFALPSFLLAMVGPCGIRALTKTLKESGKVSGRVFALSSVGSIAGVLVTSFWLIALMGTSANLRLAGLISVVAGVILTFIVEKFSIR